MYQASPTAVAGAAERERLRQAVAEHGAQLVEAAVAPLVARLQALDARLAKLEAAGG